MNFQSLNLAMILSGTYSSSKINSFGRSIWPDELKRIPTTAKVVNNPKVFLIF